MLKDNPNYSEGISSTTLTLKSNTQLLDIFKLIIEKKVEASANWINNLEINEEDKIIIIGAYLTGIGIAKKLAEDYNNILLIDIYPHLKELITSDIPYNLEEDMEKNIKFSSDLNQIYTGDIIIDTTGIGGINSEFSSKINCKAFLIEDPISEDNDAELKNINDIYYRLSKVNSENKAVLKTQGLNTKTSGTMTLGIKILTNSINELLSYEGVLYSACEMTFFEDIIFKEKNIEKFSNKLKQTAIKVSSLKLFKIDEVILNNINQINSEIREN